MSRLGLQLVRVTIAVPGRELVRDFDATLAGGTFIAVLGVNGAGKSLLLRTLAGLRPTAAGSVRLEGTDIAGHARRHVATRLGFLPQDPDAAPQGMVRDSVLLGRFAHLGLLQAPGADDEARTTRALADVGLEHAGGRDLATLSGGEQRRAAIARLLVQAPDIYLLDEPTNHLDPAQQLSVLERFGAAVRAGATVVASLHDPNLALRFADEVWLLDGAGGVAVHASAALEASQLTGLYGIPYLEARAGAQRFMAPGSPAGNR